MNSGTVAALADYFTPAELVELLDIDTESLIMALVDWGDYFNSDTVADLEEIMEHGS